MVRRYGSKNVAVIIVPAMPRAANGVSAPMISRMPPINWVSIVVSPSQMGMPNSAATLPGASVAATVLNESKDNKQTQKEKRRCYPGVQHDWKHQVLQFSVKHCDSPYRPIPAAEHGLRSTEHPLCLVDVAPYPGRGRDSAHDRMLSLEKVPVCMLARRGIATANVAARLALAKSDPKSSFDQALFAGVGRFLRRKTLGR